MTKLYVGNLPYSIRDEQLGGLFSSFGKVVSATVIMERGTNRSKGFGFVEFEDTNAATAAIAEMNEKEFEGRKLVVNEAKPMEARPPRPSFGGNSGGYDRRPGNRDGGFRRDNRR